MPALWFLVLWILVPLSAPAADDGAAQPGDTSALYVQGKLFFKVRSASNVAIGAYPSETPGALHPALRHCITRYNITSIKKAFTLPDETLQRIYVVEFSNTALTDGFIAELQALHFIEYAERVPQCRTFYTPNDAHPNQWALPLIQAERAWDLSRGNASVVVAIVDDAVLLTHEDLAANIWTNPGEIANNNIDDDANGYIDDVHGYDVAMYDNDPNPPPGVASQHTHGTHCAGIAAGVSDNNMGIASLGFGISIMAVKCRNATTQPPLLTNPYEGVQYAIAARADVISMSWGSVFSQTYQSMMDYAHSLGIVLVAAAGNNNHHNMRFPAAYKHVIAVGATDETDHITLFSNYGSWLDVFAPGEDIWSCIATTTSSYDYQSGTSMACPLVAGLCGLMLSVDPTLTPDELEHCLKSSCVNIDSLNPLYRGWLGAGRIDAYEALRCLSAAPTANFWADHQTVCATQQIHFRDTSLGAQATGWQWLFPGGTPSSSMQRYPTVSYVANGTYNVSLTVTNTFGTHTVTKQNYITIQQPSATLSGTTTITQGNSALLAFSFTGIPPWQFTYTDGTTPVTRTNITTNPAYILVTPSATTTYTLTTFKDVTCTGPVSGSATITVWQTNCVDAGADVAMCSGNAAQLNATGGGNNYTWTPATGLSNPNIRNPLATPAATTTYTVSSVPNNLVVNANFDAGNVGFTSGYIYSATAQPGRYGVTTSSRLNNGAWCIEGDHTSGSGNFLWVDASSTTQHVIIWQQTVTVQPFTDYNFSCWVSTLDAPGPGALQFTVNGQLLGSPFTAPGGACYWVPYTNTWNSGSATTATIGISNQSVFAQGNDMGLDDIIFIPVCPPDSVTVTIGNDYRDTTHVDFCPGDVVTLPGGATVTMPGIYPVTFPKADGCDSTIVTQVVTRPSCCVLSAAFSISDTALCPGDVITVQNQSATTGGTAYNWSFGAGATPATSALANPSQVRYTAAGTHEVRLIVTNICGADTIKRYVHVSNNPVANAGRDTAALCVSAAFQYALGAPPVANYAYSWFPAVGLSQSNSAMPVATLAAPAVYFLEVTDLVSGCKSRDTVHLAVSRAYRDTVQASFCPGQSVLLPNGANVMAAGVYPVTLQTTRGCDSVIVTNVVQQPGCCVLQAAFSISDTALCAGDVATVQNQSASNPSPQYRWIFGAGAAPATSALANPPAVQFVSAGAHEVWLIVTSACGADTIKQFVHVSERPVADAGRDTAVACVRDTFRYALGAPPVANYAYSWFPAAGLSHTAAAMPVAALAAPAVYYLEVTDLASGCKSKDSVQLTVSAAITGMHASITQPVCLYDANGGIKLSVTGGAPPYVAKWNTGAAGFSIDHLAQGAYLVTVTDAEGCTADSAFALDAISQNSIEAVATATRCGAASSGSVAVHFASGISTTATYAWSTGDSAATLEAIAAGIYSVTVTDSLRCRSSDTATVAASDALHISGATTDATCADVADGAISIAVEGGTAPYTFAWSNGATEQDPANLSAGAYLLTVSDALECGATETFEVRIAPNSACGQITIWDVFSPNGDGVNDNWIIDGLEAHSANELQIFNRWGSVVYEAKPYTNNWNGTGKNNDPLPSAAYYYILKLNDPANTVRAGSVTVVR